MSYKTLSNDYSECYEQASKIPQQKDVDEVNFFVGLVPNNAKLSILDLGCAEGKLALSLSMKGHQVTASDISQRQLDKIFMIAKKQSIAIEVIKCNIEEGISQFNKKTFDIIFFMDVIEHLKSPIIALENIRNLLKDGGTLFINTPNSCTICNLLNYAVNIKKARRLELKNIKALHFQTYDYLSLEYALCFVGFSISEIVPTKLTLPLIGKFKIMNNIFKYLSNEFPSLSDNLLIRCRKENPVDIDDLINLWEDKMQND